MVLTTLYPYSTADGRTHRRGFDCWNSSNDIAELTGKRHADVMRDIRAMIERLSADADLRWHCQPASYSDSQGKTREQYRLDKNTTIALIAGYDPIIRMRIINRWQEKEEAARSAATWNVPAVQAPALTSTIRAAHMTSREIADMTGKRHDNIIRAMIERLEADPDLDWHCRTRPPLGDVSIHV